MTAVNVELDYAKRARQACAALNDENTQAGIDRVYADWLDWANTYEPQSRFRHAVAVARFNAEVWIRSGPHAITAPSCVQPATEGAP